MIDGFTAGQIAVALSAALAASFIRGLAGFGMALLLVPILGLVVSPQMAVVTTSLIGVFIGVVGIRKIVGQSEASAVPISVYAVIATPLGLYLLIVTDPDLARLLITMLALAAFVVVLLPKQAEAYRPGKWETGATGIASGVLTGFAGMPGPPVIPYYLRRSISPELARASMMAIFLATSIAGSLAAWAMGLMSWSVLVLAGLLFPAILLGNWLGSLAFGRVSPFLWRWCTGGILGVAAIGAVYRLIAP